MYEPHMHAFSPHVSRGYADQQNSQPVNAPILGRPWGSSLAVSEEKGYGHAPAWVQLGVGDASAPQAGEKPDGIRSAATRQHYIQIYQAMKYLSLDVADFMEKGPPLAELPGV
jgi:hypothetical protein